MTAGRRPQLRVLLVEDEPANRALVRAILARADRERLGEVVLREAGTILDARSILTTEPVDVVLLDVRLPDGSGLDLAADLRARSADSPPRIVVLSASVLPTERAMALAAGADDFLGKPFSSMDLVNLLQAVTTPADA
jgi:CheY-like chemotaxis protein